MSSRLSLIRTFRSGATWTTVGSTFSRSAALLTYLILARILGQQNFGKFALVQLTLGVAVAVGGLGLGTASSKFVAQYRAQPQMSRQFATLTVSFGALCGLAAGVLLFALSPYLGTTFLRSPNISIALRLASAAVCFNAIDTAQTGIINGLEAFKVTGLTSILKACFTTLTTAITALGWGLNGACLGIAIAGLLNVLINSTALRYLGFSLGRPSYVFARRYTLPLLNFCGPTAIATYLSTPATWISAGFLARAPSGYTFVALFAAATQLKSMVAFLPGLFAQFGLPVLVRLHSARTYSHYRKTVFRSGGAACLLSTVFACTLAVLSPFFFKAYGRNYEAAAPLVLPLLGAAVLSSLNVVVATALAAIDRMWNVAAANTIAGASLVMFAAAVVPLYGHIGLAYATLISESLAIIFLISRFVQCGSESSALLVPA